MLCPPISGHHHFIKADSLLQRNHPHRDLFGLGNLLGFIRFRIIAEVGVAIFFRRNRKDHLAIFLDILTVTSPARSIINRQSLHLLLGEVNLYRLGGLNRKMPVSSVAVVLAVLSMVGIPPTCGFFSKWYLMLGAYEGGQNIYIAVLVVSSLLNAVYYFRIIEQMFVQREASLVLLIIIEEINLDRNICRHKINAADRQSADIIVPHISASEEFIPSVGYFRITLRRLVQSSLVLPRIELVVPHKYPDPRGCQIVLTQFLPDLLAQFHEDVPDLFVSQEIGSAGDPVPNAFDGHFIITGHDAGNIETIGVDPDLLAMDAEYLLKHLDIRFSQVTDGLDAIRPELGVGRTADVQQIRSRQRPYLFPKVVPSDLRDRIRLLHIRTELCEYLIEADAD